MPRLTRYRTKVGGLWGLITVTHERCKIANALSERVWMSDSPCGC